MGIEMETLDSFMDRLASPSPAPGGGAASSMVALVGASLTSMVSGLTIGKKGYEESQKVVTEVAKRSGELIKELRVLMKEDEEAFNLIVNAWKMPKTSDEEKRVRKKELENATRVAISVPWKIAGLSQEVLRLSAMLVKHGNRNAITDAGCSLEFSLAAIKGVLQNVKINLKSLSDQEKIESEKMKIKFFVEDSEEIYRNGLKDLEAKL